MSAAFEQAWSLLKAAFQPTEGTYIGSGMNQAVYGQDDNPDVVKVGDMFANPTAMTDMYLLNRLAEMYPGLFASQAPIQQTAPLPIEAKSRFPMLSIQERGIPFAPGASTAKDALRGRAIADAMYSVGQQGPLFEALGMADLKPPNWMKVMPGREARIPEKLVTGKPGPSQAVIMDPMFTGPANVGDPINQQIAVALRGTPRKLGQEYSVPEESLEGLARSIEAKPFQQFIEPVEETYYDYHPDQTEGALDRINQQERHLDMLRESLGI